MLDQRKFAIQSISVMEINSPKHRSQLVNGRDFYALSYRLDGMIEIETAQKSIVSKPDSVTFTPKGMSYKTTIREDTKMIVVHFRLARDLDFQLPYVLPCVRGEIKGLFELLAAKSLKGEDKYFECMSIFYRILSELGTYIEPSSSICDCSKSTKALIDTNFGDQELDVAALASAAGVSDSYLRRVFKRDFGEAPLEYLNRVRIQNAKKLLESEYLTVDEVAKRCGFNTLSYFIQSFHAKVGETPGAYRKRKFRL